MADLLTEGTAPSAVAAEAAAESGKYSRSNDMLKSRMTHMVKGAGFVGTGNAPLSDPGDIMMKAHQATLDLRTETHRGYADRSGVVKGLNQDFLNSHGYLKSALTAPSIVEQVQQVVGGAMGADLTRSFTAGNLGNGSVYGLVPFDLLAPSRLIYPVYTVFRNKLPRPPGQGTSRQEKVFTGISGSQTGGQGIVDIAIPELVQSGGGFGSWPLNLPGSGSQTEVNLNVPYRFFGLTEQLSWLAQFAGQGFEDVSALANLILLQEMMLAEEYAMIAATSAALATPAAPTVTVRTAGANEAALTGVTTNISVKVTAVNYYGETIASPTSGNITWSAGQVADVQIAPVAGAQQYNIYVGTNSATSWYLMVGTSTQSGTGTAGSTVYSGTQTSSSVGGLRFTLQGALATSAVVAQALTVDTGTGNSNRMEGLIPTLTGASATAGVYPTSPVPWKGGYVNQSVGTHLSYQALYSALDALWETGSSGNSSPGAFRADPGEIVGDGGDIMRLSNDVIAQGAGTNYRLFLDQPDVSGVRVGAAVSEFQNPITRSVLKLVVHPWLTQGTALLMSYQLPQTWSNVANAWEMTMVQDYCSIAWPVIDATFRYSIFMYGALVAHAPQYSGILQGLQVADVTPYS